MFRLRTAARSLATVAVAAAVAIGAAPTAAAHGPEIAGDGNRFHLKNTHSGGIANLSYTYGSVGDGIVVGDWDGNGTDTLAVRRGSRYHLRNTHSGGIANLAYSYGTSTDVVLVGDWDGNGTDTLGLRRGNRYYLKNSHTGGNADITYSYGTSTDVVLVGDWDGDGTDTLGLRRGNRYYLKNSHTGGNAHITYSYGSTADAIMAGDWDGNGTDTLGVRRLIVQPVGPAGIREAQQILAKFAIPAGPVDGIWGAQTAQGICTFRQFAGLPVSRSAITTADLIKLRQYNATYSSLRSIPAPSRSGSSTYLLVQKTCQTMSYVSDGRFTRISRVSTGQPQWETPAGNFTLGGTYPGWSCSTIWPEACYERRVGMNARTDERGVPYSTYGNMYNKRSFYGAYLLHGSGHVPTYPASHGCIRVTVAESDWYYRNLTNSGGIIPFSVIGRY